MKIAYLDCFSGISGDMFLGALLDAGLAFEGLKGVLSSLPFHGYELEMRRETRNHILGTRFLVKTSDGGHGHRDLTHIRDLLSKGDLSPSVKNQCLTIFEKLAAVEGRIHNVSPEKVKFHEVGAVDSIIDIVGTVYGIETLGIHELFASPLPLGSGFASTAHGRIPLPAPATMELLKGVPVFDSGLRKELVTPTGALLLTMLKASFGAMPPMVIQEVGYGVGKAELTDRPNLLRVLIGSRTPEAETETVILLETNLDDAPPEWMGFMMERLFEAGALDVVILPVQMKKNRPGVQVQVLGRPDQKERLLEILFKESATLGVRFGYSQRRVLKRNAAEVDGPWGKMRVKEVVGADGSPFFQPEYEVCRKLAIENHTPLREIYGWVMGLNQERKGRNRSGKKERKRPAGEDPA
jgi:pyridinium-3,5-bisthiocarboxylic acid mononucleotide nickel chelatase